MIQEGSRGLRKRLRSLGLRTAVIQAAWPQWWTAEAEASPAAQAELRFALARNLGLDPRSLLESGEKPRFVWSTGAAFKGLTAEAETEREALISFGRTLANLLFGAVQDLPRSIALDPLELRGAVLHGGTPFVRLLDLLGLAWALGIPVVHPQVYPMSAKGVTAMTVRSDLHYAVLLAKDSMYPAPTSFYLAHEIGHIALGHLGPSETLLDAERLGESPPQDDEEHAADAFALQLLTGQAEPKITVEGSGRGARSLAQACLAAAPSQRIEPGILALIYGFQTDNWSAANGALRFVYSQHKQVWEEVNRTARDQLNVSRLPVEAATYLSRVLAFDQLG